MDPRRYPLPHGVPFDEDDIRPFLFPSIMAKQISNEHLQIVKLLLSDERVDPSDVCNYAIRWASRCGHLDIVKFYFLIQGLIRLLGIMLLLDWLLEGDI